MTPLSEIAEQLGQRGIIVCLDFLAPEQWREVRRDLLELHAAGQFRRAGVGHGATWGVRDEVRRDEIFWLDPNRSSNPQSFLWSQFEALQTAFNRTLFMGLKDFQAHYAVYPEGGFYDRHLDASISASRRRVSLILYLNDSWREGDGGELRIHQTNSTYLDIAPKAGTLVCFLSQEIEHEVLPSYKKRLSCTGWYS